MRTVATGIILAIVFPVSVEASESKDYSLSECIQKAPLIVLGKVRSLEDQQDAGVLRTTVLRVFKGRLDDHWVAKCFRDADGLANRQSDKTRHSYAMEAQQLFAEAFVAGNHETGRPTAGERHSNKLEKTGDVGVQPAVVPELLGQVEDDVRFL